MPDIVSEEAIMAAASRVEVACERLEKALRAEAASRSSLQQRFRLLRSRWLSETRFISSSTALVLNSNYQRIIGLGPGVIPLILDDLSREQHHWFWALGAVSGENPVPSAHEGNIPSMVQDWLAWGRGNGYLA